MPNASLTKKNTEDSPPNGKNPRRFLFSGSAIFPWGLFPQRRTAPHFSVLFSIPAFHPVPYGRLDMLLSSAKAVRSIRHPVLLPLATFSNSLRQKRFLLPGAA